MYKTPLSKLGPSKVPSSKPVVLLETLLRGMTPQIPRMKAGEEHELGESLNPADVDSEAASKDQNASDSRMLLIRRSLVW